MNNLFELLKTAYIGGESVPSYVGMNHSGVSEKHRLQGLLNYMQVKAKEHNTSWPKAIGVGGLIGGGVGSGIGALAGGIKALPLSAAVGAGLGAGIGAVAKHSDDIAIAEAKAGLSSPNRNKTLHSMLLKHVQQAQLQKDMREEARHQQLISAIEGRGQ